MRPSRAQLLSYCVWVFTMCAPTNVYVLGPIHTSRFWGLGTSLLIFSLGATPGDFGGPGMLNGCVVPGYNPQVAFQTLNCLFTFPEF